MDLYSRRIIGWSLSERLSKELAINTLDMAIQQRRTERGLIHHSDRGSQYTSYDYQRMLWKNGMRCSMSRKGYCWDNAHIESFFKTLKVERIYQTRYETRAEARRNIFQYIEIFYNRYRIHLAIGYVTPEFYEKQRMFLN